VTFQPQFTPSNWRRQCLQDRIVSLLQVMHTAKTTKVEPSYKSCHNDICFKTKTVVAHAAKCWTWHARFFTCDFITDWSIASYQEILWSIVVEDKLTTPSLYSCRWNVTLQVLYQLPLILQRSDKTVWQVKCHAAGVIPTPLQLLFILRPSACKPEQHILKPVRQIWAMESTETSRG